MTRTFTLWLVAGATIAAGATGCGRSSLLFGDECPAGQYRDQAGNCVPIPDGGIDLSRDLARPDLTRRDLTECVPTLESCSNGQDDDCDERVDCQDPDCLATPMCQGVEICDNGIDDDKNGATDCKDPFCADFPDCRPKVEICDNGQDDDGNGLADCMDPACAKFPGCLPQKEICDNGQDDDRDGAIDCRDPDCATFPACIGKEVCDNGQDDDRDGAIDCRDADCFNFPGCLGKEICDNGQDDDRDGATDCKDTDCATFPACRPKEICNNNIDDDKNGLIDCKDPACFTDPRCVLPGLEICNNNVDDDNDGFVDCKDPDCAKFAGCQVQTCDPNKPDCTLPICANEPACQNLVCKPTVDFGPLARNDASVTRVVNTLGTKDVAVTQCALPGGGMVVTQLEVLSDATSVRLDYTQITGSDHVFGLFRAGINQKCEANPITCFDPKGAAKGGQTFVLNKARYYLIVQSFSTQRQGQVTVTLSTPPSARPEVCNNGFDDDGNGLIDCADPACLNDQSCVLKICKPDINVGTLVLATPPVSKSASFTTQNRKGPSRLTCGSSSPGGEVVLQFTLAETAGVLVRWNETGDHVMGLFRKPPTGQLCDYSAIDCYRPFQISGGEVAWSELPPGEYLFIFQAIKPGAEGNMNVQLSAYRNRKVELCRNAIDDDGDGLIDCLDPDCKTDPACGPPVCQPDVNFGTLSPNGPPRSTVLDTRSGIPNEKVSCARGGGLSRIVQFTFAQPLGLGVFCQENGGSDHVLGVFAQQGPRDPCDKFEVVCADHKIIPFGCNYEIPNMQPGTYYVIAQAFQPGKEGLLNLTLQAIQDGAIEVCNNNKDDDGDGQTDCADFKCAVSPYCIPKACKPDETIDPMPTTGQAVFKLVQTAGQIPDAQPPCQTKPGGGNAVILVNMPQTATLTVAYAQIGQHVFSVYPVLGSGLVCDASQPVSCQPSTGANSSGQVVFPKLPTGKYYFVAAAAQPGDEGSVSLRFTAAP